MDQQPAIQQFEEKVREARRLAKTEKVEEAREMYREAERFAIEGGLEPEAAIARAGLCEVEGNPAEAVEALEAALAWPELRLRGLAWFFKGSAHDEQKEYAEAVTCYRKALDEPNYDWPGYAWYNMGVAFSKKGDHDEAIECYRKALDEPSYDTPGDAWNNMGVAFCEKGDYDEAIECYRKALDEPSYDRPGYAWSNMGNAFAQKGDRDEAIECYRKALDEPRYDTPGYAWNNMGNVFAQKGDRDEAIECYRKALDEPSYDTPGYAWNNMGIAFYSKGDVPQAIDCWTNAERLLAEGGEDERAAAVRARILAASVEHGQRSSKDEALLQAERVAVAEVRARPSPEERMVTKLAATEEDAYKRFAARPGSDFDDVLAILKGWGSSVPLIEGGYAACRGGGYFLKWKGKGLAVDPGFDFLSNFREAGFHPREINAVIVSHDHTDHNDDLRALDDIKYELAKRVGSDEDLSYLLLSDKDTASIEFDPPHARHRAPDPMTFDLAKWNAGQETVFDMQALKGIPFRVHHFPAYRHAKNAFGFRIECISDESPAPPIVVGFSCDTQFKKGLCAAEYLKGSRVLVAHISQPDMREFDDPKFLKKGHLGYRGVEKLIKGVKPELTIVCEFWAGLVDLRIDLIHGLRRLCQTDAILPGGLGLFVRPAGLEVCCTTCRRWFPYGQISVASPPEPFGPLQYLCPDCRL